MADIQSSTSLESLLAFDQKHIWHPYTSMIDPLPVYPVRSAKGVYITLENGQQLIDGMSSWWCAIHGYNHPTLNGAIETQLKKMSHVMFGGLTHRPAIELSQKLIQLTPSKLDKVFLCDSGSVSVEVAIKMAFQYWIALGNTRKSKLMSLRKGYHGDTFGAMAVCDPDNGMHHVFNHVLPTHHFVDAPVSTFGESVPTLTSRSLNNIDLTNLEKAFQDHHEETAAFILEPIVQGAGGMRMYAPSFLQKVRELCDQYHVLLIADEIATGFGRTGEWFACDHADVQPDIMCLGKALTGGMMTMAATLCTSDVAQTICQGELGVFMHGPTFMANPLACSVALASIELLEAYDWKGKIKSIEGILSQQLNPLAEHKAVKEIRVLGAIGVVECQQEINVAAIQKFFVDQGVWIRPFRNLIYVMPPFIMEDPELVLLCEVIKKSLSNPMHFKSSSNYH